MHCNRTRIYEEGSLLVRDCGSIFGDGQACLPRRRIEIIHRDFIVPAAEVGIWVCQAEVGAISPSEICIDWTLPIICSGVNERYFEDHR